MVTHFSRPSNSSDMPFLRPRRTPATKKATSPTSNRLTGILSMRFSGYLPHYAATVTAITSENCAKKSPGLGGLSWRVCRQPIADGARLRILRVILQHLQIMLSRLDRLVQLLEIQVAQRQVRPAIFGICLQQFFQFIRRIQQ